MAGRQKSYLDERTDTFRFFQLLATTANRHDTVVSNPSTRGLAFNFRQRLYGWRRSVLAAAADPADPKALETREWLQRALGPRATFEWLGYTKFSVVDAHNGYSAVVGEVTVPMIGPDIVFVDSIEERTKLEEARKIVEERVLSIKGRHLLEYAAKGNPEIRKQLDIADGLRPPDPRPSFEELLTPEALLLYQAETEPLAAGERPDAETSNASSNVTQLPTAVAAASRLVGGVDTDAIAFDRRCDPNEVRRRATTLAGDGLSPDMIEEILQREFR